MAGDRDPTDAIQEGVFRENPEFGVFPSFGEGLNILATLVSPTYSHKTPHMPL